MDQTNARPSQAVHRTRTLPGIGEMFHPCGSCLGFIAGLNEVLQRFTQMFGDLQTSSRPRVINALQVDHACFHSTTLGRMGIPLTWPPSKTPSSTGPPLATKGSRHKRR